MLREPPRVLFRKDHVPVRVHLKDSAAALDEFSADSQLLFNGIRKTCGFGMKVSLYTVFDGDFGRHGGSLHVCIRARGPALGTAWRMG